MLTLSAIPTPRAAELPPCLDVNEAWRQLTDEQRREIGVAGIVQALGSMAVARNLGPFDLWDTASDEGQAKLEEAVVAYVAGGSTTLPRPDLAAIGVRACDLCGCTDDRACVGGCQWVGDHLCSCCAPAGSRR